MSESVYTVQGMTCGHCVSAVREEVSGIDGVQSVDVDLDTGKLTVTSATPVSTVDVQDAVAEAGYELVPA